MDIQLVFKQFATFAGLDAGQFSEWETFCQSAADKIAAAVRPQADPTDARLIMAAAGEAYYRYSLLGEERSVKIGDLSIGAAAKGSGAARELRDQLLSQAMPLLVYDLAALCPVNI